MKNLQKITSLLLALALLAGCGAGASSASSSATPTPTPIPTPSPTPDISKIPGTVALVRVESKLNLREQPSVKSAVLAEIPGGAAVQVLQSGAVWSKIAYEDQTGWVGSKFLEIVRN